MIYIHSLLCANKKEEEKTSSYLVFPGINQIHMFFPFIAVL